MRSSIESIGPVPFSGGAPLPSFVWQAEQETRLKDGPKPSKAFTEAGASTQLVLNRRLPNEKGRWCLRGALGASKVKASGVVSGRVVSPPSAAVIGSDSSVARSCPSKASPCVAARLSPRAASRPSPGMRRISARRYEDQYAKLVTRRLQSIGKPLQGGNDSLCILAGR